MGAFFVGTGALFLRFVFSDVESSLQSNGFLVRVQNVWGIFFRMEGFFNIWRGVCPMSGSGETAARREEGGRKVGGKRKREGGRLGGSKKNPLHLVRDGADLLIVGGFGGIT